MPRIAVVCDSTASVPDAYAAKNNISVVPLYLNIQGEALRDGVDISPDEFYARLPKTDPLPTTSQPSAGDFSEVYRRLIADGAEGIISVHISSGISGTVASAQLAAQEFEGTPIEIVDTKYAAAAHLLVVEAGVTALNAGGGMPEAVGAMQRAIEKVRLVFAVDTLEYLYKGGRIRGAAALLGSVLQFKPLLHLLDGRIAALERVRTSKRALLRLAEVMVEWTKDDGPLQAIVIHAACLDRAEALAEALPKRLNVVNTRVQPITPVVGTHVGPGAVGIACGPVSICGTGQDT